MNRNVTLTEMLAGVAPEVREQIVESQNAGGNIISRRKKRGKKVLERGRPYDLRHCHKGLRKPHRSRSWVNVALATFVKEAGF